MSLQQQWAINGKHYSRTLEDWLRRQDRQRAEVLPIMKVRQPCPSLCALGIGLFHTSCIPSGIRGRLGIRRNHVCTVLQKTYGDGQGLKWMVYWRLFYLACSELFNYNGGEEWFVSHYLFEKK